MAAVARSPPVQAVRQRQVLAVQAAALTAVRAALRAPQVAIRRWAAAVVVALPPALVVVASGAEEEEAAATTLPETRRASAETPCGVVVVAVVVRFRRSLAQAALRCLAATAVRGASTTLRALLERSPAAAVVAANPPTPALAVMAES